MATEITSTCLRENLSSVLNRVVDNQEVVIVRRKGKDRDVALIPASELAGFLETAHLLQSPRNAKRLLAAFRRTERHPAEPSTTTQLRQEHGLTWEV